MEIVMMKYFDKYLSYWYMLTLPLWTMNVYIVPLWHTFLHFTLMAVWFYIMSRENIKFYE